MPIKFVCSCGKHLRARDEMASRRSLCPRCGAPVGIPALQPTHRGTTLGPMSLVEGQRIRQAVFATGLSSPAEARQSSPSQQGRETVPQPGVPLPGSGWRHRRWVETHWYESLLLPRGAWPLVLVLSFVLTAFCGSIALSVPGLYSILRAEGSWLFWLCAPFLSIPLLVLGYGSGTLDCVLASAMAGEVGHIRWPGRNVDLALRSGVRWLVCFLAGPVVPAGTSVLYWIHAGELGLLDWIILVELNILAISVWFLLLLAANQQNRLRDINPVRVIELIRRLGQRLLGLAVFAAAVVLAHGWLASLALEKVHHETALGWLLLFLSWISGMFFATFLFRWVGVWLYWDRIHGN